MDPRWVHERDRRGQGVSFYCPCPTCERCERPSDRERLVVAFSNPVDGGAPIKGASLLWQREGDTFATLTLDPAVDASGVGHWRGHVRRGDLVSPA
jgi:hypothetical protein